MAIQNRKRLDDLLGESNVIEPDESFDVSVQLTTFYSEAEGE